MPASMVLSDEVPGFLTFGPLLPGPADAGGLPTRLIASITESQEGSGVNMLFNRDFMALSPDHSKVAVVAGLDLQPFPSTVNTRTTPPPVDGQDEKSIAVMDMTSGAVRVLSDSSMVAVSPSWSPDGRWIAYVARPDTGPVSRTSPNPGVETPRRVWTMAADGSNAYPLAPQGPDCRQERPLWSADG